MPAIPVRVGVVFGGASGEHSVSIRSAITVINALQSGPNQDNFSVVPLYIDPAGRWWPETIANAVLTQGQPLADPDLPQPLPPAGFRGLPIESQNVDVWFPVLHGPNGEDGTVQGLFTLMRQPFVGSGVLGSAVGMDKLAMKAAFAAAGLPQVPYVGLNASELHQSERRDTLVKTIETNLGYPCFVKPANMGSSVGISKARNREQLLSGLKEASSHDSRLVVEQGVTARELECAVMGRDQLKASVVGEISFDADWYDYETKYCQGLSKTSIPAPLPADVTTQVQNMALQACTAVHADGLARVDVFYDELKDEIWLNEINTLPGFTSQSMYPMLWEASGVALPELVAQLVQTARE